MGYAHVVLVPVAERKRDIFEIILDMQNVFAANIPDSKVSVSNGGFDRLFGYVFGGGGYGLDRKSTRLDSSHIYKSRMLYSAYEIVS